MYYVRNFELELVKVDLHNRSINQPLQLLKILLSC